MIPQRSAEQAITLADQGWNLSAIARHLGHDRRTIRIYLNGRRKPGQPRSHTHSFAPFASYAARRLRDDPHLRAWGLHRELTELGYRGSYSALTRELRNSGIATTCPACEHRPHSAYSRAPINRSRQSLPMRVAPLAGETIASYLGRLAAVNHLPVSVLLTHLPPWFTARTVTHDDLTGAARANGADVESLAALSGLTATTLLHALPGFRSGPDNGRPSVRATHACLRCAARHGHTEPIPVHLSAHQRLCARHRFWLGNTTGIDLAATPEIIHAQRLASRLARRYTGPRLMLAEATALQQIIANRQDDGPPDLIRRRITALASANPPLAFDHPDLIEAATYPETISNAADALTRSR